MELASFFNLGAADVVVIALILLILIGIPWGIVWVILKVVKRSERPPPLPRPPDQQ